MLAAFCFDYLARLKLGGTHLTYTVLQQLPVLTPENLEAGVDGNAAIPWIRGRVLELTYTAWDLQPFAQDCGYDGPPFRWDEARRFLLRCELDAAFFHLYGIERDDVDYIMETFPIVKRKDVKKHGDHRTKLQILDIYDAMQRAIDTGEPYQTLLDPPPADPRVAHPPRDEEPAKAAPVVPFPSVQPDEMTSPSSSPELMEEAEPQGQPEPTFHDEIIVDAPSTEGILSWLEEHPGWHARADIVTDLDVATPEWNVAIRDLVDSGEVERKGRKRGTRYRLMGSSETADEPEWTAAEASVDPASTTPADQIVAWLQEHSGWHSRAEILDALGDVSSSDWNQAIRELVSFGEVGRKGEKRGTRYRFSKPVIGDDSGVSMAPIVRHRR